jgi:hypothetical protein
MRHVFDDCILRDHKDAFRNNCRNSLRSGLPLNRSTHILLLMLVVQMPRPSSCLCDENEMWFM